MLLLDSSQTADQIIALYKTLLEQENSNHTAMLTILLAIAGVLVVYQWWWNKDGANKYINEAIREEFEKKEPDLQTSIEEKVKKITDEKTKDHEMKFGELQYGLHVTLYHAELREKNYNMALSFLSDILEFNIKENKGKQVRQYVNSFIRHMNETKEKEIFGLNNVIEIIKTIPDYLSEERKQILKTLKEYSDSDKSDD